MTYTLSMTTPEASLGRGSSPGGAPATIFTGEHGSPAWRTLRAPSYRTNFAALRAALGDSPAFDASAAEKFGIPPAVLKHHRRQGRLWRAGRGLYRFEDQGLPDFQESVRIAALPLGPDAIASHATALRVLECTDLMLRAYEFIVTRSRRYQRRAQLRLHTTTRPLPAGDVTVVAGIRTTTLVRSILDAAKTIDPYQIEIAVYEGTERGILDLEQLRARMPSIGAAQWTIKAALQSQGLW